MGKEVQSRVDALASEQLKLPPRERIHLLPPEVPPLTLGWAIAAWMMDNLIQPNGPNAGQPFVPTDGQVEFLLHWYAVNEKGEWLYTHAARRLAKGSGKSPFAAACALAELCGPVRVKKIRNDMSLPPWERVEGQPMSMPLVQIAATSEAQTLNTMRMIRAFAGKRTKFAKKYGLDTGKTQIETPDGGMLMQITASASSAEGAEASFVVADETEHWLPGGGGPAMAETLMQNLVKTGGRMMETSNAWVPGVGSVAESTFDDWCAQEEGKLIRETKILYDARIAPHNTALTDNPDKGQISLTEGLEFVYEDCSWANLRAIREQIWKPSYPVSRARRFFLNQPNAVDTAWITVQEWSMLADPAREVAEGEEVVLFFDGSKSNDHTALVGCCMSDGHIFTVGVWAPDENTGVVDAEAVDAAVRETFEKYEVMAFYADVREWESYVKKTWPDLYKEELIMWAVQKGKAAAPIAWDMRSHGYEFAEAAEMCHAEIKDGQFTHDGNWETSKHIGNARATESRGRITIKKESPKSPNKIDAAVCVIGARMVYRAVLASDKWEKRNNKSDFIVW